MTESWQKREEREGSRRTNEREREKWRLRWKRKDEGLRFYPASLFRTCSELVGHVNDCSLGPPPTHPTLCIGRPTLAHSPPASTGTIEQEPVPFTTHSASTFTSMQLETHTWLTFTHSETQENKFHSHMLLLGMNGKSAIQKLFLELIVVLY